MLLIIFSVIITGSIIAACFLAVAHMSDSNKPPRR